MFCPLYIQVITNGLLSFGRIYLNYIPSRFPLGSDDNFLVAPFWADVDIQSYGIGSIAYEVHNHTSASSFLDGVSKFISNETGTQFTGRWMLLAEWNDVPHYQGAMSTVGADFV